MNADPDEGQPTTVPEPTAPAKTPPEATAVETVDDAVTEADATEAEADTTEPDDGEVEAAETETAETETAETGATASEAEATEAEASEPEAVEAEAPESEATSAAATEAEAEASEPEAEATEAEAIEPEPEPDPIEPEPIDPEPTKPAAMPPADTTPLVAGRYRLVSEIGGGAMGVVWRARDEVLGRDVAVKELRPDHGMSGAQVRTSHQRARREGRIAARLQHPNAVVIYDVAEHDGRPYLIMEYVPSQSLGDILATGAVLTPTEVTSIGAQLASALTAAHERGIVHRDIKPGNVLMTADGTVKLTDFGISRAAGDATVTATGEILGTPAYTAPEVAQGHPVAFPADVFSLGATLYAAVEGTPPFGEDVNAMALLLRVVRNEIRQPKRSGPLTDTIMWMLNPEPADRPTMKQVWQGLDRLSAKPLPVADIRASAPVTKAFEAPSPTLVVTDPAAARRGRGSTVMPEQPIADPPPSLTTPAATPMAEPPPAPASTPISAPLPTPPVSAPISTPTSASSVIAATPTSAMAAVRTPTRNTEVATSKAKKSPAVPPPPTDDHSALTPASPPPDRRSRMPLAIAVCVVGTAVLIVAIVVAMNSGDKSSPNQPAAHGSTTPTQSAASHPAAASASSQSQSQTSSQSQAPTAPSTKPSSSPSSTPSSSASTPSTSATDTATQMTTFLMNYYGLLPNNLTAAWPQMTAPYQTYVAKGFDNYQKFWGGYQQVTLTDVVATLPSTVVATIHYVAKDGTHTDERTSFGLVKDGTSFKIDTSHVIG
jgi:eukaryotic-like serine/threonine-protein kinase